MVMTRAQNKTVVQDYLGKRGMEYYNRGVYDKAAMFLGRLLEQKPDCIKTSTFYGLSLFWLKRFSEAIPVLEGCLAGNMIFRELPLYLAYSYYSIGDTGATLSLCQNFLLNGHVSEECKKCAKDLCDSCREKMRERKPVAKSNRLQRAKGCFDIFQQLLMKEQELMRYF
jgi:tetratricopeptide (TPR) repeat protein